MAPEDRDRRRRPAWSLTDVLLCILAVVAAGCLIAWFWPGSIGWDFQQSLEESASRTYSGHQPQSAAVAVSLLTLGTSSAIALFIIKVVAYFGTLIAFVYGGRAPLAIRLGGAAILFAPAFLYLAPLLRGNGLEMAFLGLGIASGVSMKKGGWAVSVLSLLVATLFSSAPHPGHAALVLLFFLWHFPDWSLRRHALAASASAVAILIPVLAVHRATGGDRSSTLYVSALNGTAGLVKFGAKPCLPRDIVRGAASASQVLAEHNAYPDISDIIWASEVGFQDPYELSVDQRKAAIDCWRRMIRADPRAFLYERIALLRLTMSAGGLEPHFVFLQEGTTIRLNTESVEGMDLPSGADLVLAYGHAGEEHGLNTFLPYLILFSTTSLLVLLLAPGYRLFSLAGAVCVVGFCLPQMLMAQGVSFRYYSAPAFVATWISLLHVWILLRRTRWGGEVPLATRQRR